ncbi:GNAT family N-acetyltransferase [Paenalkalicoccus suaedae]|uniref:GNAT family N-acetyltransferase n=1 Tax=Paenalkalicoccus suaedae TaxID=2592382 RepID=A0A859FAT2_9BACI|nr:GNAT family N-acetyltransferase [Paenalkalicoccus suaedae]QKS69898.1 GNAT family N-acetyltransferase [Paenalkalicoccus suaedae]
MRFSTERLEIRPFMEADLADVSRIYMDAATCEFLLHDAWTEETMRENFAKKLEHTTLAPGGNVSLAVVHNGEVIGDLSAWYTEMKDTVEIGYSFYHGAAGHGFAQEAVRGLLEALVRERGVHRIQATLDARNVGSKKLCERVGMRQEAHFIKDYWNKGEWTDSYVFGVLGDEIIVGTNE